MTKTDLAADKLVRQQAGLLPPPEPEPEDSDEASNRKMDLELRTIGAIIRLIDSLTDVNDRARVVRYLSDRYHPSFAR